MATTRSLTLPSFLSLLILLLISAAPLPASAGLCNKNDKKALLAFAAASGDPFPTWTSAFACCDWYGVTCNDTTGRVIEIDILEDSAFTGPIPPSIGDLPFLSVIRLHKLPNLAGPIPPQITKLTRLRFLTVSWTNISGSVPAFLGDIPTLESLDLSFGNLSGSIPASLGNHPRLYSIDLSRNRLTGTIPPTLFQKAKGAYLLLSHNQLTGAIPAAFGNFDLLKIDLSRNQLTGDAAFLFGQTKNLQQVILSRNQLEFDLTNVVFSNSTEVFFFQADLSHNMIYGSIPQEIVQLPDLQFFNVSYNRLCGPIPTGGQMGRFDQYSYIHNKCLCGTPLPPCK